MTSPVAATITVAHLGPVSDSPGGIAQVARSMLMWPTDSWKQVAVATTEGRGPLSDLRLVIRALATIRRQRRRGRMLLHVHLSQRGSILREGFFIILARTMGIPAVAHIHGSGFVTFAQRYPRLVRTVLDRASAVLCLTQDTVETLEKRVKSRTKVVHVFNSVPDPGPIREAHRRFVFGGTIGRRKGVDVLLDAWSRVDATAADGGWSLMICGPESDDIDLQSTAGLRNVDVRGSVQHAEMMEVLAASSAVVLPSRAEAFPMFLVEGMIRGAVAISTDVGDVRVLLGDVGWCVAPGDADGLAEALLQIMEMPPELLARRRSATRNHMLKNFGLETVITDIKGTWADAAFR